MDNMLYVPCVHMSRRIWVVFDHRTAYQFIGRANINHFMGRPNQIKFFVRFKTDRRMNFVQYDPYVYHVVCQ